MLLVAVGRIFIAVGLIALVFMFGSLRGARNAYAATWTGAFGLVCLIAGSLSDWLAQYIEPWFTYIFPPLVVGSAVLVGIAGAVRRRRFEKEMLAELAKPASRDSRNAR